MAINNLALQNDRLLSEIVDRLLAAGRPLKVVLFGSRAHGSFSPNSDYDLLLVEDSKIPRPLRPAVYRKALKDIGCSKDIVVWTPEEIIEWENVPNAFVTQALREGIVLYERTD